MILLLDIPYSIDLCWTLRWSGDESVIGVTKVGNIGHRAGFEPTSLAFGASVLPLHHGGFPDITALPTPTCICGSLPQRSVQTKVFTDFLLLLILDANCRNKNLVEVIESLIQVVL